MTRRRFLQLDVFADGRFASEPSLGNPLAVVVDGEGVDDDAMSRFSSWTNLSEVTFLLPPTRPEADYRVRIWNLARELSFAGHPTLGSCHAWLESGGVPKRGDRIVQECPAGLVEIRRSDDGRLAFAAPPLLRTGPLDGSFRRGLLEALRVEQATVVETAWVVNGPQWLGILLDSAEAVLAVDPDPALFQSLPTDDGTLDVGLVGFHADDSDAAYEVRALFRGDDGGLREDPVTGSLNASIAQWLLAGSPPNGSPVAGRLEAPYVATQGTKLDRQGRVHVDRDGSTIWIGGATKTVVTGTIDLG